MKKLFRAVTVLEMALVLAGAGTAYSRAQQAAITGDARVRLRLFQEPKSTLRREGHHASRHRRRPFSL